MTSKNPAITTFVLAAAVASLVLAGCAGDTAMDGAKGWQCTAQDEPGSTSGGPRLFHHNDMDQATASQMAMAQCKQHSDYAATCSIKNCEPL